MKPPIGLYYGSSTGNSETIARMIVEEFKPVEVHSYDILYLKNGELSKYKNYIFGIPTWDKQIMHEDWDEFLKGLNGFSFSGKRIALFGLGDQKMYPKNFVDDMGRLYFWLQNRKADIIGHWPVDGYRFTSSDALINNKFVGLALDEDRQSDLTASRVRTWVKQLKSEFGYE